MKVRFIEVGRDKKTWEEEIPIDPQGFILERCMRKSVKNHRALMSLEIDFSDSGAIYAGGRNVGEWKIIEPKEPPCPQS